MEETINKNDIVITKEVKEYIKSLGVDSLKAIRKEISDEIESRKKEKVIYVHDCYGSSQYHFRSNKHWAKIVTALDDEKTNGYAFNGKFLDCEKENLVPKGSYVVEMCYVNLFLYVIKDDYSKELLAQGVKKEFISFIKKCKPIIEKQYCE
ncbi:MAG: hypothetical protein SPE00_05850 [Bacilli bacterium]|nr:hypothetical protein [Bacilli bacterium]